MVSFGTVLFITGAIIRRTVDRDVIPSAVYLAFYATGVLLMVGGYIVSRREEE